MHSLSLSYRFNHFHTTAARNKVLDLSAAIQEVPSIRVPAHIRSHISNPILEPDDLCPLIPSQQSMILLHPQKFEGIVK